MLNTKEVIIAPVHRFNIFLWKGNRIKFSQIKYKVGKEITDPSHIRNINSYYSYRYDQKIKI